MITTVTLNPALDMTLGVKEFRPDDSNRVEWVLKNPGGKGINVSRIVNLLGGRVNTIAFLGGYAGKQLRDLLRDEGVILWEVESIEETRTNVTFVVEKDSSQTRLNQRGAEVTKKELKSLFNLIENAGDNADFLVVSGSLPPNAPKDTYYKLIQLVKNNCDICKIVLDADGDTLRHGLRAKPFLVKPNVHEMARLLHRTITSEKEIIRGARDIQKMGAANVIVSRGGKGAMAVLQDGSVYSVTGPRVKVASTVGAGDAFVAGLVYKLDHKKSFIEALKYASAVSTAMVMTPGTELCRLSDVKKLSCKVHIHTIEA